jgi:formylmethanofuran dehydrogenase subunit A
MDFKEETQMKYTVNAYLFTNFAGLMDSLETDNFYEVQDFVEENRQKGFNCKLVDNERGTEGWAYAENDNDFYEDLFLEQCEQM